MTDRECSKDSKVISITKASVRTEGDSVVVDRQIQEALGRYIQEGGEVQGSREIELYADDQRALESESHFKARFGLTLGRRGRIALFEAIDRFDLTSEEVKVLHRVGAIDWDGQTLWVGARAWIGRLGTAYSIGIGLLGLLATLAFLAAPREAFGEYALLCGVLSLIVVAEVWIYKEFIWPFQLLRQRRKSRKEPVHQDE